MSEQCNVPVALIFFTRPDTFKKVFEAVRKAKPKHLFLIQDGAREGRPDDVEKVKQCREIAETVDWECTVYRDYSEVNLGCGMRPSSGISWVFEHVDRAIILEDDCVPCETFFPFCDAMLEKYKDDDRIGYISGLNHFEEWDCGKYSYFFTKTGAIWGWATWKRAWEKYDYYVHAINDKYISRIMPSQFVDKYDAEAKMKIYRNVNDTLNSNKKLSFWDGQWGFVKYSQNQLVIVPKYNQISNIGVGVSSTHAQTSKETKFIKYKNFFFIPTKNLEFPLTEQTVCMQDLEYDKLVNKCAESTMLRYKRKLKKFILKLFRK